jgi:hypothetical protein
MPKPEVPRRYKSNNAEWTEQPSLFIKDYDLGKYVYEAASRAGKIRVVANGEVLYYRPADNNAPCDETTAILWPTHGIPAADLHWDAEGCLRLKDEKVIALVKYARDVIGEFKIEVLARAAAGEDETADTHGGGGVTENKVNAMCLC